MSEQTCQDVLVDVDALLEELRNLPEANEYRTEPGSAHLTNELHAIYSGFIGQFFKPDITIYVELQNWLTSLIDPGLCTAGHRKQIVDILELAIVVFENIVSVALKLTRTCDPLGNYPTESDIRTYSISLIDQCLASQYSNDVTSWLQRLRSKVEERESVALASMASDTKWLLDLWGPEFGALDEKWLSEDLPDAALDIVANGLSTAPISSEAHTSFPATAKFTRTCSVVLDSQKEVPTPLPATAQLARTYSVIFDSDLQSARSRPLTASRSLNVLPTLDSRPMKVLPKRVVSLSRTKSLSTMLPPQAQRHVITALGTVTEE